MEKIKFLTQDKTEGISGERYEDGAAYAVGAHVIKDGAMYVCTSAVSSVPEYDSTLAYSRNDYVRYPGDYNLEKGVYSCDNGVAAGTPFTLQYWTRRYMWDAAKWSATTIDLLKQDKATAVKYSDFASIDPQTVTIAQLATILKGQNA